MKIQHKTLAAGRWDTLDLVTQLSHVGSEIERTIRWKNAHNRDYSNQAFERALELLDLTISCRNNKSRLKELVRVREALLDYFLDENSFQSTDKLWQDYFYHFAYAARLRS